MFTAEPHRLVARGVDCVTRSSLKTKLALVLAATGIAALAGCGDSGRTVPTSSMTTDQFVKRAEAVCAQGRLRGLRYEPPSGARQSERDVLGERIADNLLPALRQVIDELYELGAPAGRQSDVEALLTAMQDGLETASDRGAPTLKAVEDAFRPAGKLAQRDGLRACIYG